MAAATAAWPYVVSCAGCMVRRAFATVAGVGNWARSHKCWEQQPTALKRHVDTYGEPDPTWKPEHG